jgi:NTE family protein
VTPGPTGRPPVSKRWTKLLGRRKPTATAPGGIVVDEDAACGYRRPPEQQAQFDQAAETLRQVDGWSNPDNGNRRELVADLALEGGGVKGIGLVGAVIALSEAGYSFRRVAGASAGAIAASLIAALSAADQPMTRLRQSMGAMDFSKFMPKGKLHAFLGDFNVPHDHALILSQKSGLYTGDYLGEFLGPALEELNVRTFGDLKLTPGDDPDMSMGSGQHYRLVVHASDITRGKLVRLPWDYGLYGHEPDTADVVQAVRASMSIPFFFEPVTFEARAATVQQPGPSGRVTTQQFEAGTVTWVDGGLLRNFPINAFDRIDGQPSRWPTIGIKLSSQQTQFPQTSACETAIAVGLHCVRTMLTEWDSYLVDKYTAGRTIFVDNGGLASTDFDLSRAQQDQLFLSGVNAATRFVIEMADRGGTPRTPDEAAEVVHARWLRSRHHDAEHKPA